ncbi:MAG: apolipoprotein N-acyltransferase [Clostridia bacterium]|nr:apolipoprotein N-acyltransferase [Clostridia bacterium]
MNREKMRKIIQRVHDFCAKVPQILCLPLSAVLMALCLLFPQIGAMEWFVMIPAVWYLFRLCEGERPRLRRLYGLGFLYFYVFYLVVWHWFIDLYPMAFAGVTKGEAIVLIAICWFGLSLLQTVFSALVFPVFGALSRTRLIRKYPVLTPFLFASVYTVAEWAQTLTWAGVPWARLSLGQAECGLLFNSASLFGSYFITFAIVAVNGLAVYGLLHLDRVRIAAIACAAVFCLNLGAGAVGYLTADADSGDGFVVAAVQGNVGSSNKWTSDSNEQSYAVYEKYTAEAAAAGAQLVVFPETFLPYRITESNTLGLYVRGLAVKYQVTIRCGGFHYEDGKIYNGLFTVYPDGSISKTVYAKRRPVPFGEYVPMRGLIEVLIPPLADMSMLADDLDPGTDSAIVDTSVGRAGSLICFDSIYENLTLASVRDGAEFICLSTNDSWFLDSAGVYMHHTQARLRAIESGRYIIRSADTGISSIIAPDGSVAAELPPLVEGVSISTVYPIASRTLYSYIGNIFVYLLIAAEVAMALDAILLTVRRRRRSNE